MKISIPFRRWITIILAVILLISGKISRATGEDDIPYGSNASDLENQLIGLWGKPYELRQIGQGEDGIPVYETMTFDYGPAVSHMIPNIYTNGSLILSGVAVFFPYVTVLWAVSAASSLAGTILLPALWSRDPEIQIHCAAVTISRYTGEEGAEQVPAASQTTSYLCYTNMYDTSPSWVDVESAETIWTPTEDVFHGLAP